MSAAFKISNGDGKRWKEEFTWLHDLRDAAVHPMVKARPSEPHPTQTNSSYEVARYCLENCERAMALLLDVLRRMDDPTAARTAEVRRLLETTAGSVRELLATASADAGISVDDERDAP